MDDILNKAIDHFLRQLNDVVEDLLLIEVDWGDQTPASTDEVASIKFQGADWPIVFTNSELVLRRALCRSFEGRAILLFRSGNGFILPLDIRARAHRGTSHRVGLQYRLQALSERAWPPEVDYTEWRPSVERHFDELVKQAHTTSLAWSITRSDLELFLVQAAFGLKVEGKQAPELLADLVSAQHRSPVQPTALERALLQGQLRLHQVAWAEILLWAAEEVGRAEELTRTGLMMAAEQAARYQPNWGSLNSLRARLVNQRQMRETEALDSVIRFTTDALKHLHHSTRQSIVKSAETHLAGVLPLNSYNPWFPMALEHECGRVAERLSARDTTAVPQVTLLRDHLFAEQQRVRLSVLDEMAHLVEQWHMQDSKIDSLAAVSDWAKWYAEHGSRMDLSALKLMQQQGTGLDQWTERLLKSYWAWRDQLSGRFGQQFVNSYERAIHDRDSGVFGTHRLLEWVVRPMLGEHKRVLLLVVDGMGFAAFWHLVDQWSKRTPPVYAHFSRILLSLLPSVTSVSRRAMFLNALPTDRLDDEQAYEDKARVTESQALQRAFSNYAVKLYNKTNLGSGEQLLNDLQFPRANIIAAIFNGIDDDLKSTTTTVRLPDLEDMGLLENVVRTALSSGWAAVITADHGHTWHRDKDLRRGDIVVGGGERFAPLDSEVVPAGTIVTQDPHIVRVQEGKRVALLTVTGAYFGRTPRRGYHGGAALEEIVVPCATLALEIPQAQLSSSTSRETESERSGIYGGYDLTTIVLTLPDRRTIRLSLPIELSPTEVKLLQALARLGEASEKELKQAVGTRRIAGVVAGLRDRMATEGLDYIEQKPAGPDGPVYRFRIETLK